jgi:transcriptional regulator with GAF, ATPase, and Fis domain
MAYLRVSDPARKTIRNHPIRKPILTIGRDAANDIVLDDGAVAPNHVNLIRKGDHFTASILDKNQEIFVNGRKARAADLAAGDRLQIGRFELTLLEGEPTETITQEVAPPLDAMQQLVDFSQELMRDTEPEHLFDKLLRRVIALTRAEKGFVIVMQDGGRALAASHGVRADRTDLSRISDSILDEVVQGRKPIIVSDALHDEHFATAASVVDLRLSSVICVPLIYRDELLGAIYLGNDSITDLFTNRDLSLLQVFASQAAMIVHTALMLNELKTTNRNLREQLRQTSQGEMIGSSLGLQQCFNVLRKVAPTDATVLILGETGTGKELVAREIHRLSNRARGPFISINCGAIPENLLESELFGHKKGSFTGALADKVGKFEAAAGGTLFLDEICEMPMNLQVKLLRVLQERVIERIGEITTRPIDIRVLAATNKNLDEEIANGRFREDLFYRLNDVPVRLPPLRDRGEDILVLGRYFLNKYAEQYGSRVRGFTNEAMHAMAGYYWPGNVRQLESRVKQAVIMADHALLTPSDMGVSVKEKRTAKSLAEAEEEFKLAYVKEVLELNNWNKAQTARDLDVDPRTIFRYIDKLGD